MSVRTERFMTAVAAKKMVVTGSGYILAGIMSAVATDAGLWASGVLLQCNQFHFSCCCPVAMMKKMMTTTTVMMILMMKMTEKMAIMMTVMKVLPVILRPYPLSSPLFTLPKPLNSRLDLQDELTWPTIIPRLNIFWCESMFRTQTY